MSAAMIACCTLLTSCGDDPELVRKREEQRAEIQKLEGELSLLQEQLASAPKDRSVELAELQAKTAAEEKRIAGLEGEIADLEARKRGLQQEFESYKKKYTLR